MYTYRLPHDLNPPVKETDDTETEDMLPPRPPSRIQLDAHSAPCLRNPPCTYTQTEGRDGKVSGHSDIKSALLIIPQPGHKSESITSELRRVPDLEGAE